MSVSAGSKRLTLRQWDKVALYLSIAGIVALSWWYLIEMAAGMSAMSMPKTVIPWSLQTFLMMFLMWTIMMVGMMIPSAVRTLMIYASVVRQTDYSPLLATLAFSFGYLLVWTGFSLFATLLQGWLSQRALLSEMMASTSHYLIAVLFIIAGIYQLTPLKQACLKHCQSPIAFISSHFKKGYSGGLRMGLHHGLYCLGCCWVLMGLLFTAGVMNLLWILAITLYVLFEKLIPTSRYSAAVSAVLMMTTGIYFLIIQS